MIETQLLDMAREIGQLIGLVTTNLHRRNESNQFWGRLLKEKCQAVLDAHFGMFFNAPIRQVSTPYNTDVVGKGRGLNILQARSQKKSTFNPDSVIYCLDDIVDGTWNAAAGHPFSTSTMLAFTKPMQPIPDGELTVKDFWLGVIIPFTGEGFYYATVGEKPKFRTWFGEEEDLHLTDVTDCTTLRCFIDLFTTQTYEQHKRAIRAVAPIMYEWADFARWYGAGGELMALLGRPGVSPAFGGYVAANQKTDNIVSTSIILQGAGARVSDWHGSGIGDRKIEDRTDVIFAANDNLYLQLFSQIEYGLGLPELLLPERN